jgi:hypothetical protein
MIRLAFLDPGHFHAALTLRVSHPRVSDDIAVYATDASAVGDFLGLVKRFNHRREQPTRWRPVVVTSPDPLGQLIAAGGADMVVLAGRNGGKARTFHRLHDAGFHVLADKPWLVEPADLEHVRASLLGWPLVMEIMTGRHDLSARLFKRLVESPDVFGGARGGGPALEFESVHQLEKLVDGAPLRRPWWFFDVRVQGSGIVDIPTHVVDQAQWLLQGAPELVSAEASVTTVPLDAFSRITGETEFPAELRPLVGAAELSYRCNAELRFRIGAADVKASTRWELCPPPAGADASRVIAHGALADVLREQGPGTRYRRRLVVEPVEDRVAVAQALRDLVASWQAEFPGVQVMDGEDDCHEIAIPPGLDGGHETHFPRVLNECVKIIESRVWPAAQAARTLAKYTLLAAAQAQAS